MIKLFQKPSLYLTLGIIIISTVTVIMSINSAYSYESTKNKIIADMKNSSRLSIVSLQQNISSLMASYAVNEYDNLISNEITHRHYLAIIVEDYNMGGILGKKSYITGKIRNDSWGIIDFDAEDKSHNTRLAGTYFSNQDDIVNSAGKKIGSITIYTSNHYMNSELNKIITDTLISTITISLLLILSLFIIIRLFVLKPLSNIITTISNCDADGIPLELTKGQGSREIYALSNTMNNMISSIRRSRIIRTQQHDELIAREDQLLTLSLATEQSPVSIVICSSDNIIEYANPQFEKTCGFATKEVIDRSIEFLFQYNEKDQNQISDLKKTLTSGNRWMSEINPQTSAGESYTLRISASPISLECGEIIHYVYVAEDITAYQLNEEMLRNSQKMDAVGQLTGGIAHDFNNLLGIIMGSLDMIKINIGDQPKQLERISRALAGAERGANLTRKLLNFSRQDNQGQELTKINPFVESLQELIAKSVTASITVETHLAENLWPVKIEPGDLEDAILNLSLNARDAMPGGGLLVIETDNKHLDDNFVKYNPGAKTGDYVMVSVSDTGSGISEEVRKKIFDPFFTTKEPGKGTGLGLSMVYGFVQRSGGYVQLYSEVNKGSSFHIYLPRAMEEHEKLMRQQQVELPRGNETILVVDDEKVLATTAEEYLRLLGYNTLQANNAKQALNILTTNDNIDLIFSDVVMPDVDGFELSFKAIKLRPKIKLLLTSGFTSKHVELSRGEQVIYRKLSEALLGKPYNLNELAFAIRNTLDEPQNL